MAGAGTRRDGRSAARRAAATAASVLLLALGACTFKSGDAQLSLGDSGSAVPVETTAPLDPALQAIVDGTGMTALGRQIFLAAGPHIDSPDALANDCAGLTSNADPESTHTFGCYTSDGIFVRTFAAYQLHDLVYVVAAHELLHAAYQQTRGPAKITLEQDLQAARAGNTVLEDRLKVYAENGTDSLSEVHSVLGTEFSDLSQSLEAHYNLYFDRTKVLAAYQRTLGARDAETRSLEDTVDTTEQQLTQQRAELDALKASGDLITYNARIPGFNALVDQHNAAVGRLNQLRDELTTLLAAG